MSTSKPTPLFLETIPCRQLCPVCGKVSYSREGIHPQCAVRQADAPRVERLKELARTIDRERTR